MITDRKEALEAVRGNIYALNDVSSELKNDFKFMIKIIKIYPGYEKIFQVISKELLNNAAFILKAMKFNEDAYEFASDELKKDKLFCASVIAINKYAISLFLK
ncbi:MAG: DUF4116 domain-containing protein [SAR324 cluster bacterium]|nr:DUF4116 domain-containing protein [SAR324 cluster bacterium]